MDGSGEPQPETTGAPGDDESAALAGLAARVGHSFAHPELLAQAMTHRSYANERGDEGWNYERLEFLGDAVLGAIVAEWLYEHYPQYPEGELSKLKSYLVSAEVLAIFAEGLGLGERLRLGVGEERSGGRVKASLLADSMEAVIGAVYLDGGLDAARQVALPLVKDRLISISRVTRADAKTELQELAQAQGWALPEYRVAGEQGPDHEKVFTVECWLRGAVAGIGVERSKKKAEQKAASAALARVRGELGS